jgi:hypothetical protein
MATMIDLEMIRNPHTVSGVVIGSSGVDIWGRTKCSPPSFQPHVLLVIGVFPTATDVFIPH